MEDVRRALDQQGYRPRHIGDGWEPGEAMIAVCPCCMDVQTPSLGVSPGMSAACWSCDATEADVRHVLELPQVAAGEALEALISEIGAVLRGEDRVSSAPPRGIRRVGAR